MQPPFEVGEGRNHSPGIHPVLRETRNFTNAIGFFLGCLKPTASKEPVSDPSFVSQDQELVGLHGGRGLFVDLLEPLGAMLWGWSRFVGFPHDLFAIVMVRANRYGGMRDQILGWAITKERIK
jgi:hypothetical protein